MTNPNQPMNMNMNMNTPMNTPTLDPSMPNKKLQSVRVDDPDWQDGYCDVNVYIRLTDGSEYKRVLTYDVEMKHFYFGDWFFAEHSWDGFAPMSEYPPAEIQDVFAALIPSAMKEMPPYLDQSSHECLTPR